VLSRQTVTEIAGETVPQGRELAVGVAIHPEDSGCERRHDVVGDDLRNGMRVLVDIECNANWLLRSAIRPQATKIVTDGAIVE
jgi:hypothetical protein